MAIIPPVGMPAFNVATPNVTTAAGRSADADSKAQSSNDFGNAIQGALNEIEAKELTANQMARDAATGKLQNIEDYMLAASDAQLTMELTVAVRDRAIEAFNDIMRMQV